MGIRLKEDGSSKNQILITSLLFMGLGHLIFLKQYIKGAIYAAIEIIMLVMLPNIITKITGVFTLGSPKPNLSIKLRDNSMFMLIDGVITIAILVLFFILYYISVRSALASYKDFRIEKRLKSNRDFIKGLFGKAFPIFGLAPTVLLIVFFVIVPLVFSCLVAFTNYSTPAHIPPNNTVDWVGLNNFKNMFSGNSNWTQALGRVALWTFAWAILATFTTYFGGMIMAVILLDRKLKIAPLFRGIFILPYAIPSVVSMLVWRNLLNGFIGTVNRTLQTLGIIHGTIPWLSDPWMAKFTCVLINLWAGFPYFMLLVTGTMTAISADLYEAARIDGAGRFQLFRKITLPLVLYQTMPLIIMSFTFNFNNFGAIFFLTGGNPNIADSTVTSAGGTDILATWIYKLTINMLRYNTASVLAIMIFIVLAPFAIFNFRRTRSFKEGEL